MRKTAARNPGLQYSCAMCGQRWCGHNNWARLLGLALESSQDPRGDEGVGGRIDAKQGIEIPMLPLLARTCSNDFLRDRIIEVIHAHPLCLYSNTAGGRDPPAAEEMDRHMLIIRSCRLTGRVMKEFLNSIHVSFSHCRKERFYCDQGKNPKHRE